MNGKADSLSPSEASTMPYTILEIQTLPPPKGMQVVQEEDKWGTHTCF